MGGGRRNRREPLREVGSSSSSDTDEPPGKHEKRARSPDEGEDEAGEESEGSLSSGVVSTDENDIDTSIVPPRQLFVSLLSHLQPSETVEDALSRLSALKATDNDAGDFDVVANCSQALLLQHGFSVTSESRKDLVAMAVQHTSDGAPLPPAYGIRWAHAASKVHGPVTREQLEGWQKRRLFEQKPAKICNINDPTSTWREMNSSTRLV